MPAIQTLTASRNATWAPPLTYDYEGGQLALTGAHIAMQVRAYGGASGDALLSLPAIAFTDELVSGVAGQVDEKRRLTLSPRFDPATLAAVPSYVERGAIDQYAFDIRITYADGVSELLSSGTFVLAPGVTTA